ncbi:hypothetical protein HLB44_00940 [Aquincola sp. S2]|uniref:Uncharacterized protein n=1 Tax=Pseudaquabacterium terrae TaxID=2732868 RepID=A0ABX2EAJ2_9BURK|nr:hypothetical protein [Aquabacterium terrae]NRF65538.1 hypothetical protein [Aquabacterium terrae]
MEADLLSTETHRWWITLCVVSALNVLAWVASAAVLKRRQAALGDWPMRRLLLLLAAGYVAGCAYRSVLPVFDVQRQVLVDSWWSSVLVGRSVATLAELCFAAQWALLLHGAAEAAASRFARAVALAIVPMIALAELCSWSAVLTTNNLGHVIEEALWGSSVLLLVASLCAITPRSARTLRPLFAACAVAGVGYVAYMFTIDVPMYWARWVADEAAGRPYFSLAQGWTDVSSRWVVSHAWDDWKGEVTWMSLYFSVAVWMSIGLTFTPAMRGLTSGRIASPAASARR